MKFLTSNFPAKILALVCALALWIYVSASESKIGYFPGEIPIEVKNKPLELAPLYEESKVKVKISAPFEVWRKLSIDNFKAFIDLSGYEKGTYEVDVEVVVNLSSVQILEKDPARIIVRLEEIAEKEVPALVKFEGEAKTGFVPEKAKIEPEKVKVRGAKSILETLSEVTCLIKLSDEEEDFKKTVSPAVFDEKGRERKGLEFSPPSLLVSVSIVPASESKTVGIFVKTKGRVKTGFYISKISSDPSTVEISGSGSVLKNILYLETKVIDIEGLEKDKTIEAELSLPSGITLGPEKRKVLVSITLSENQTEREIAPSYNFQLPSNLKVENIQPASLKTIISGPSSVISALTSNEVVLNLDLSSKQAGTYTIDLQKNMFSLPSSCYILSYLPSSLTIVLTQK